MPPTYTNTARLKFRIPQANQKVNDFTAIIGALGNDVDAGTTGFLEGTYATRLTTSPAISGRVFHETDTDSYYMDNGATWIPLGHVSGDLKVSAVASAPTGWLLCDGSAYPRTGATLALFNAISTAYGVGDGSTTFNVPDLQGRTVLGAGSGGGLTARSRGQTGGEETHTLAANELPSEPVNAANSQQIMTYYSGGGGPLIAVAGGSGVQMGPSSVSTGGGGTAHNNMQPWGVASIFIKK